MFRTSHFVSYLLVVLLLCSVSPARAVASATGKSAQGASQPQWVNVKPRVVKKFSKRMIRMMRAMRKARLARKKAARGGSPKPGSMATGSSNAKAVFKDPIKRMNDVQKSRYQEWLGKLMAPCCQHQSLSGHDSPKADLARKLLQKLILKNKVDKDIRATFTRMYGEKVFSIPPYADIVIYPILGSGIILLLFLFLLRYWGVKGGETTAHAEVLALEEQGEFLDE